MANIYEMARQRIAGATIKAPTKKVSGVQEKAKRAKASPKTLNSARFRAFLFIKIYILFIKNILTSYKELCIL